MQETVFKLTQEEDKKLHEFYIKHKECCKKVLGKDNYSTIGGRFTFMITPTGLGNIVCVKCNSCEQTKDITDIESW